MRDSPGVLEAKQDLRRTSKERRKECFERYGTLAAERLAAHGLSFLGSDLAPGIVVSGLTAIGEEIDPLPLLLRLRAAGFQLALPAMQGKGKPLIFRAWQPGDPMVERMWGIREPQPTAAEVEPQVVLAALLAFDRAGYRLGYGGGFYDRTLAAARRQRSLTVVGVAYDEQEVPEVPHLDYDQRLDWVLTPSGPIRCLGN